VHVLDPDGAAVGLAHVGDNLAQRGLGHSGNVVAVEGLGQVGLGQIVGCQIQLGVVVGIAAEGIDLRNPVAHGPVVIDQGVYRGLQMLALDAAAALGVAQLKTFKEVSQVGRHRSGIGQPGLIELIEIFGVHGERGRSFHLIHHGSMRRGSLASAQVRLGLRFYSQGCGFLLA